MADEAFKSFTSLLERVPGWIAELEGILKAATARQKEALEENQPVESAEHGPRKASKTSSTHLRWLEEERIPTSPRGDTNAALLREQMPHMTQSDALRLSQRKRKTTSVCSDRESAPVKYRSTSAVVVYYDGDVQKSFETLVRAIASTRNSLRKGRMSAKVDMLSRTGSSGGSSSDTSDDEPLMKLRKIGYRSTRLRSSGLAGKNDGTETFDKADGCLEKAQALCERAAHQVLRDGDCTLEVNTAKTHFEDVQKLCEASLPDLRKKAEKAAERQKREEERRKEEEAEEEDNEDEKPHTIEKIVAADPIYNASSPIEVDLDADDSDGGEDGGVADVLIGAIKVGRYQMRSTRLATC